MFSNWCPAPTLPLACIVKLAMAAIMLIKWGAGDDMYCFSANMNPVYYQDCTLQLNLPPTANQFKKNTVDNWVKHLIQSACQILQNEQLCMQQGTKEDGIVLIQQLHGM